MAVKFGVPPEGERIRSMVEERLRQAMAENGAKVTVEWRGEQKHLSVISMPVDLLYLNPDTHRIRAQRTLDPEQNQVLEEEPWSEDAQDYLALLLSRNPANPTQTDPDFTALQDELDDFGQKEPGIISPDGILVDGNTRCAALRKIGIKDIRVGVLPADTSRRDINNVELALQLRKDKRREYSYINRLIAIEEELANGRRPEDVARDFNIKTTTLRQDRWVYELVNDAIDRSKDPATGVGLRLVDFEDHQEKLRELQRDYTKLAKTDPDGAEQLKESRLAMVVLNYPKTSVRLAEADFHTRFLDERLPDDLRPAAQDSAAVSIPGLPGVAVQDGTAVVKATRALTDNLLKAKAAALAGAKLTPAEVTQAAAKIKSARGTFDVAVKMAGQNAQLQKRKIAVPERLTDAADYVNQCAAEFAEAKAKRALDEDSFDDALLTLRASLARLAKQAGRTFSSPGDGVEWLLNATRES
ncbi:ParB/RepB/Spo0J family partition protein [Streptomyces sp. JUS-F4]|uniref:ParB/RepB/Spo0J family partition protein n=1 Tax=unclassified Streptomyces TaxID=2593676 RepID=UPI0013F61E38|nr:MULTISPECIES: ParB/RepB/Spo0J family partition protein [unclassified Streptomyces]NHI05718.1 ParB domain-containing protein nuclease [Streptomyces sp. KO7888]WKN18686.1 ParB/RepB/Spo0J family partition protein [Streptomyces sp. JUS-F4]